MRAYHRVDPLMDEKKSHYTPSQLGAFMKVQLLAGRQAEPGFFRSKAALEAALPPLYAVELGHLLAEHDLIEQPDGRVYVDGYREWQEGDLTVAERMRRLRERKASDAQKGTQRNGDRNGGRNGSVSRTVTTRARASVTSASPAANARRDSLRSSPSSVGDSVGVRGVTARENGSEPMSPDRAQAVIDDPDASDEAKAGARAYLDLAGRWGKQPGDASPARTGEIF